MTRAVRDSAEDPVTDYGRGGGNKIHLLIQRTLIDRFFLCFYWFFLLSFYVYVYVIMNVSYTDRLPGQPLYRYRRVTRWRLQRFHENTKMGYTCGRKHVRREPNALVRSDENSHGRSSDLCLCVGFEFLFRSVGFTRRTRNSGTGEDDRPSPGFEWRARNSVRVLVRSTRVIL